MGLFIENTIMEFLYASLLIFWIIYLYFVKDYGYWEERNVPHVAAVFPFGSLSEVVLGTGYWGTAHDKIYKQFEQERYVGLTHIRKPWLLVRDPELVKRILQDDFSYFMNRSFFEVNPKDYMSNHLFTMKGTEWKEMRMKLTPAYTAAKMKMMFCLVKKCSDVLRGVVKNMTEENNVLDVKDLLSRFTIDIISTCAFGLESDSLTNKDSEFYKVGKKAMNMDTLVLLKLYVYSAFPIFTKLHCFDFCDSKVKEFLSGVVQSAVEYREKYNVTRYDFLDLLIKLRQNQSILEKGEKPGGGQNSSKPEKREGMTIEEITAETFIFFAAGYETTSNTSLFCLYELACNSRIQDKVYSEVQEILDRYGGDISYQALQEMTYMDQVINESMRRYPVLPELFRECTKDYKIPKSSLEIEKDLKVVIPVYSLHHDPKYFPDPYTFDPDRFSPDNCNKRHPYVYLPFGEGPRKCIGLRFGLMKVKTAVATLVLDYQISLTPETEVPLEMKGNSFTTVPSSPLMLVFTKRKGNT
ncbi:probable cytochrome P450 6a14 isoform X2 [Homalodisca vitripennis]|nr:probable cytochrome P450 6a14 isoform X2 [Homalodisca vitripennis]